MNAPENPWIEICPGIKRRTLTTGTNMYQMLAQLDAGSRMPEHHHAQEQIAHVLSGRIRMLVAGVAHELKTGDSIYLGSDELHGVETLEETTMLDTFSPPRDDYLAKDASAKS
ncbi:MAG: cupin domain-containing protein [Verrucomicrobiota bacterium]|nr:cupin domain-containing protein [Verrucomicrobiota bacterium]